MKYQDHSFAELRAQIAQIEASSNAKRSKYSRHIKRKYRPGLGLVRVNGRVMKKEIYFSAWYQKYIKDPKIDDSTVMKVFRRRFRMPYQAWQDLVNDCRKSKLFERWNDKTDAIGLSCSSLELLVLGTLRYLGRGWTFDDIAEATGVSEEIHRQFFHVFVTYGSTEYYDKHVSMPASYDDVANFSSEFEKAGMPGAIGSTDAVNIVMEKCSWRMRQ